MTDYTQRADGTAYRMRDYYEANRPLRWWERRNPPGSWGCIADNLMLGLLNIAATAKPGRPEEGGSMTDDGLVVADLHRLAKWCQSKDPNATIYKAELVRMRELLLSGTVSMTGSLVRIDFETRAEAETMFAALSIEEDGD
jgi:hypothetical protein